MAARCNNRSITYQYSYAETYSAYSHQSGYGPASTTGQYSRMASDGDPLAFDDTLVTECPPTGLAYRSNPSAHPSMG